MPCPIEKYIRNVRSWKEGKQSNVKPRLLNFGRNNYYHVTNTQTYKPCPEIRVSLVFQFRNQISVMGFGLFDVERGKEIEKEKIGKEGLRL